jgi:hypothetical protein
MLSLGNVSQSPFIAGILVIAAVVLRGMENVQRASLKQIIMDVEDVESKKENVVKIEADLKAFDGDNDEEETGGWVFNAVEPAVKNLKIEDEAEADKKNFNRKIQVRQRCQHKTAKLRPKRLEPTSLGQSVHTTLGNSSPPKPFSSRCCPFSRRFTSFERPRRVQGRPIGRLFPTQILRQIRLQKPERPENS